MAVYFGKDMDRAFKRCGSGKSVSTGMVVEVEPGYTMYFATPTRRISFSCLLRRRFVASPKARCDYLMAHDQLVPKRKAGSLMISGMDPFDCPWLDSRLILFRNRGVAVMAQRSNRSTHSPRYSCRLFNAGEPELPVLILWNGIAWHSIFKPKQMS